MTSTELKVMDDLISAVKCELLGIHCTADWGPRFANTIQRCEELIVSERRRHIAMREKANIIEIPRVV